MEGTSKGAQPLPLLAEWSPKKVRIWDPAAQQWTVGESLRAVLDATRSGRSLVVGVRHRSSFLRTLFVPKLSPAETARVLEFQLASLLPLKPGEYVFGYRLAHEVPGKGRMAVVGAIKTDSLRRIYAEAQEHGVRIQAVLPLAFGSWLATRERGIQKCAVVESDADALNIDLIEHGEIVYSRSIPPVSSPDDLHDELQRTASLAEIEPGPVFSTGCPGIHVDVTNPREPIEYLAHVRAIRELLFSFELPEKAQAREARRTRWKAQRALVAAAAAIALSAYAVVNRQPTPSKTATAGSKAALKAAHTKLANAQKELSDSERDNRILEVAFIPGQKFGDIVTVLSQTATPESWFTNLSIIRGAPLSVSGLALSDKDVARFSARLAQDSRFAETKVVSITRATIGKKQLSQFLIIGKPMGLLAFDRPPKERKGA